MAQRQISIDQTVQKTVETPQLQRTNRVIDGPVVQVEHVPRSQKRQLRSHSWMLSRKSLRPRRSRIESNSGMWSRSLTHQFCPLWRNKQRPPRISFRTEFNIVLENRPSNSLLFHSLRGVVEAPDTRTQDKTQHVVNTHVQHVVNAGRSRDAQNHQRDTAKKEAHHQ